MALAAVVGLWEFCTMASELPKGSLFLLGGAGSILLVTSPHLPQPQALPAILVGVVLVSLLLSLSRFPHGQAAWNWAWVVAGTLYLGLTLRHFVLLEEIAKGWVYFTILATFATDTGAFLVGRAWGKRPLARAISPHKTVEGTLGGLICGAAVSLILAYILKLPLDWPSALVLGVLASSFAQLGDLSESWLKRCMQVKDAGWLVPGHGGLLDRLDSLIFSGVVVYYYVAWIVM